MGWLFGKAKNPDQAITEGLRSGIPAEICNAAARAGELKLVTSVPALVPLLYSGNKRIIAAVADALGKIGDPRAMQHLGEAGYLQEFVSGISGFDTFDQDGEAISVSDEDALMSNAISNAEQKLLNQPGAQKYLTQLGSIRMYTFGDFWRSNNILIHTLVQRQAHHPLTMSRAKDFFKCFVKERFAFDKAEIKSIAIYEGRQALPNDSFADGYLLSKTLDEMEKLGDAAESKNTIGKIHFQFDGGTAIPCISVEPDPEWPRPSIVRRPTREGFVFVDWP